MSETYLQEKFLRVFAMAHKATANRIISRLSRTGVDPGLRDRVTKIIHEEIRGLYHGNLVIFDGGSNLADDGLVKIVDEDGTPFAANLHEIGFKVYDER